MGKITVIKGFKDILPTDTPGWCRIESIARDIFSKFGFREVRLPIMEKTELFKRSIGESTDIVEKEMYTFHDRDNELLTLRPEATASIVRSYVENNMYAENQSTRLFTIGPMFRRERPQKGRFRQFHQIDAELFGENKPQADVEVIAMLIHFLQESGLKDSILEINSLGCPVCRPAFSKAVVEYLKSAVKDLCPDCQRRMQTNPLRVFDCKVETCAAVIKNAPRLLNFLCLDCSDHFSQVKSYLDDLNLEYSINTAMVRGLDYYVKTAFEVKSQFLGAQNAVAGGGRYDGLVSFLGGPEIAGIGFAVGMERLLTCLDNAAEGIFRTDLFIAALGNRAQKMAFTLADELRRSGIAVGMDYSDKSLKSQMKHADKLKSSYTLILGDKEIDEKSAQLRDMNGKNQSTLPLNNLKDSIMNILKER